MAYLWVGILKTEAGSYTIIKLIFNSHSVLGYCLINAICHVCLAYVEISIGALAQTEAYLWTSLEKELEPSTFASPTELGKNRYLNIIHCATITLRTACDRIYDRSIVNIEYFLRPTDLGIIDLCLHGTDSGEIFFTHISERHTTSHSSMKRLIDFRSKSYVAENVATIYTYTEIITVLSYLCNCGRRHSHKY